MFNFIIINPLGSSTPTETGPVPVLVFPEVEGGESSPEPVSLPLAGSATGPEPMIVQAQNGDMSTTSSASDLVGGVRSKDSISSERSSGGAGENIVS